MVPKTKFDTGVYKIEHVPSGRAYIGSSRMLSTRMAQHLRDLRRGGHQSQKLQSAWTETEEFEWRFDVILHCDNSNLRAYEAAAINAFGCASSGFNVYANATPVGHVHGEQARRNIRRSLIGRKHSADTRRKMAEWRRPEELKAKISEALTGKPKTEAHKRKIAQALTGRKIGPQSAETIAKRVAATRATKAAKAAKSTG